MKITFLIVFAVGALLAGDLAAKNSKPDATAVSTDPDWPRQRSNEQGRLVYYQPQVGDWKNFKELNFRMAFALTPKGQKEVVGIMVLRAQTDVSVDKRIGLLHGAEPQSRENDLRRRGRISSILHSDRRDQMNPAIIQSNEN